MLRFLSENASTTSPAVSGRGEERLRPLFSEPLPARCDVGVIGGGAVGLATAMALLKNNPGLKLVVVEAENRVASHQTGNNSGVIHSGLYYKPGSLKAKLCTAGRDAMYEFCKEHNVAHEACGKVVVATRPEEVPALDELERRGQANGLTGVRRINAEQIRELEPHINGIDGLHVPQTGIVNYRQVTEAYAQVVRSAGGTVRTNACVKLVDVREDAITLKTTAGDVTCSAIVNCGGLQSDRVARLCGVQPGVQIVPFRGEYYELVPHRQNLIRNLVYPVPDARFPFLGVHFTRMVGGGVEAGPNAVLAMARHGYTRTSFNFRDAWDTARYDGFWRMARKYWKTGFGEFYRSMSKRAFLKALRRLLPELELADIHPGGAGVRAQALDPSGALIDDFRIIQAPRMVHVLNAPSPAATASIAIGRHIVQEAAGVLSAAGVGAK